MTGLDIKYSEKKKFEAGLAEGEAKGERKKAIEVAKSLVEMGLPVDKIAEATKLTEEELKEFL